MKGARISSTPPPRCRQPLAMPKGIDALNRRQITRQKRESLRLSRRLPLLYSLLLTLPLLGVKGVSGQLADCPPESLLLPCSCAVSQIYCYNDKLVHLKPIFERVARHLARTTSSTGVYPEKTNEFLSLEIRDCPLIRTLEANFTAGLSFEIVALKNVPALATIHADAFSSTAGRLERLSLEEGTSAYLTDGNLQVLASLVRGMPRLRALYLDAYHLRTLPRHLLAANNLEDLSFNYNRRRRGHLADIHSEAFYYLPSLRTLDLYGQSIRSLPREVFRFQGDDAQLETALYLGENNLTAEGLAVGLFSGIRRRLTVHLEENALSYVPREVFEPLLASNSRNRLALGENPLRMDCRNRWIASLESRYKQFLSGRTTPSEPDEESYVLVTLDPEDYATLDCDHDVEKK